MNRNLAVLVAIAVIMTAALTADADPSKDWLHPPVGAYAKAIDDGYSGLAKIGPFNESANGVHQIILQMNTSASRDGGRGAMIVFLSPLRCGEILGINARRNLLEKPNTDKVKGLCDGFLSVQIIYSTKIEETDSFPLALAHADSTIRPPSVSFTNLPDISDGGRTYTYTGIFSFAVPEAWADAELHYVIPEDGNPRTANLDFTPFIRDVQAYDAK